MIKKINVNFSFSSITRNISKIIDKNINYDITNFDRDTITDWDIGAHQFQPEDTVGASFLLADF